MHVSRAEVDLPPGTDHYSDEVYAKAVTNMAVLKAHAPLIVDDAASLYVYRLQMGSHVQTGVAGCFALAEYESGLIRRHERTRREKEDDRTRHMLALRAQTGPVFLTYTARPDVNGTIEGVITEPPLFDFAAADGIVHTLWRAGAQAAADLVSAFSRVPALYIADGHHRAASASRARRQLGHGATGDWDTFLAVAFPDDVVQVLPYNRIVKDLGRFAPAAFLEELGRRVAVSPGPPVPARRGEVSMFLDGRWYTLGLGHPSSELPPDRRLDVSRLHDLVLAPLVGIGDVTTDKRIDFVGGIRGSDALEDIVRSGGAAAAFSMFPVSVEDIMVISDAGGIMPPKSTWFEPKLRDGLLVHLI